jgi:hypothetical protein|tara:strand:- start:218 stop:424 length:207 start_codon:yes stop_codon:yes gene_type:complete
VKLHLLDVGRVFYWKGGKYTIMFKLRNPPRKAYKIPCWNHPNPSFAVDMPSNREVKPVMRLQQELSND